MNATLQGLTPFQIGLVGKCLDGALEILATGRQINPVAFIVDMQQMAEECESEFAFTILEAWAVRPKFPPGTTMEEIKKISAEAQRVPPSEHPDKVEVVTVCIETLETSYSGMADIIEIRGQRTFGPIEFTPNPHLEGPMARILPRTVRN